jgi:hypothetical protein
MWPVLIVVGAAYLVARVAYPKYKARKYAPTGSLSRTYTAVEGDAGWAIASRFGVTTKQFLAYGSNAATIGTSQTGASAYHIWPGMQYMLAPGWKDKGPKKSAMGKVVG